MPTSKESELWREYLALINTMSKQPGTYGLDKLRSELHEELFQTYAESYADIKKERFSEICHHLNEVIGFNPPLARYDSINVYAHDIEQYMGFKGRLYVIGKIDKL